MKSSQPSKSIKPRAKASPPNGPRGGSAPSGGLAARDAAVSSLFAVFVEKRAFDEAFSAAVATRELAPRDRAFARLLATSVLRNRGALNAVIRSFLAKPLPENLGRLEPILLSAAAQLLLLGTPPHAAISLAVDQCRADRSARRFDKLANAVLRRVSAEGQAQLSLLDTVAETVPHWLLDRWTAAYGQDAARAIARASLRVAPLDLTSRTEAAELAGRVGGLLLPTGSVRLEDAGRIEDIDGYVDGTWWVQDAAAALPAKLLGDIRGKRVADICAAPGGKTAQLAAAGAIVTAIDKSHGRLKRLTANLERLHLNAEIQVSDAATFAPAEPFDAVLLDAPCTATGTIRRHPDILYLKRAEDVASLAALQERIMETASRAVRVGGTLVYCTCSLEPEECAQQVATFLDRHRAFRRMPVTPSEIGAAADWITAEGDLRTLPTHLSDLPDGLAGMDGFYAARLVRTA